MSFLRIIFIYLFILTSCSDKNYDLEGIIDPNFIQAKVYPIENLKPITIDISFKPNIFNIPTGVNQNQYMVSFVITKPNFGHPIYYQHLNAFMSLNNVGTLTNPKLQYAGLIIKNCPEPCESLFTSIQNEQGEDLTDQTLSPIIQQNTTDNFLHLLVSVNPLHIGEDWEANHGFVGSDRGIVQIMYPFYRVQFNIKG